MDQEQFECRVCLWSWLQYRPGLTEDDPELQFLVRRCALQGRPILSDRTRLVQELQQAWARQERDRPGRLELHYAKVFLSESDHLGPSLLGRLMLELSTTGAIVDLQAKLDCRPRNGKARTLIKHYRFLGRVPQDWRPIIGPQQGVAGPAGVVGVAGPPGVMGHAGNMGDPGLPGPVAQDIHNALGEVLVNNAHPQLFPGYQANVFNNFIGQLAAAFALPNILAGPAGVVPDQPAVPHHAPNNQTIHPLQCRRMKSREEALEILRLTKERSPAWMLRTHSTTILKWVAYWGFDETQLPLRELSLSVNALFLEAGRRGHLELVQSLPAMATDKMRELARTCAAEGQTVVMNWCLEELKRGLDQEMAQMAIRGRQLELSTHFLETLGVKLSAKDLSSHITEAMQLGQVEMCQLLHSHGALPSEHTVAAAISQGHPEMLQWLLEARLRLNWSHFYIFMQSETLHRNSPWMLLQALELVCADLSLEQAQLIVKLGVHLSKDPELWVAMRARLIHIHPELEPLFGDWRHSLPQGQASSSCDARQDDPQ